MQASVFLRICLIAASLLLTSVASVNAAVINVTSLAFPIVSNAVASAHIGDTVLLPPGTNWWPGVLNLSGITLQGSGQSSTVIVDETPASGSGYPLIEINTTSNAMTRVTQLEIIHGVTNALPFQNYTGDIVVYGGAPLFRVDNCTFTWLTGKPIHVGGGENGLIDHCTFLMSNTANAVEVNGSGFGDVSWASPATYGTSNALFIENNYIYSANDFCAVDIDVGGRVVFRDNTLVGSFFNTHGTETGQRYRGSRQFEVYNNSFTWGGGLQYNNFYTGCDIRGGSGVVFSNTFVGYWSVAELNYYRGTDNDPNFLPWFGATGLRTWDNNGPLLLTNNATATSNAFVVARATWTSNQWVGATAYNYDDQLCGIVVSNNANTMWFRASRSSYLQIMFNSGDPVVLHNVYPALDQPGYGSGNLLTNLVSPTPVYLSEQSEPAYFWSNSLSYMYAKPTTASPDVWSALPNIQLNRDFYNDIPKPGYTPYQYPHPWTSMTNAVPQTNTVTGNQPPPTNSPPVLSPPGNLNAQGI